MSFQQILKGVILRSLSDFGWKAISQFKIKMHENPFSRFESAAGSVKLLITSSRMKQSSSLTLLEKISKIIWVFCSNI